MKKYLQKISVTFVQKSFQIGSLLCLALSSVTVIADPLKPSNPAQQSTRPKLTPRLSTGAVKMKQDFLNTSDFSESDTTHPTPVNRPVKHVVSTGPVGLDLSFNNYTMADDFTSSSAVKTPSAEAPARLQQQSQNAPHQFAWSRKKDAISGLDVSSMPDLTAQDMMIERRLSANPAAMSKNVIIKNLKAPIKKNKQLLAEEPVDEIISPAEEKNETFKNLRSFQKSRKNNIPDVESMQAETPESTQATPVMRAQTLRTHRKPYHAADDLENIFDTEPTEVTTDSNGNTTTTFKDGTKRTIFTHEDSITGNSIGTILTEFADESVEYKYADGRIDKTLRNGTEISQYPDGDIITTFPDRTKQYQYKDGSIVTKYADGRVEKTFLQEPVLAGSDGSGPVYM